MVTSPPPERTSFWRSTAGMLTAIGTFVASIGTLVGALAAAGVWKPGGPPQAAFTPTPAPTSVSAPAARTAERASIDLVYTGDSFGCVLNLIVRVGSQSVQPSGSRYPMHDVETGTQPYEIRGVITCRTAASCTAHGSGSVDVAEGRSYAITWLETAAGYCDITLQNR